MPLFSWTGNPWVDTGFGVIVAKARKETIDALTAADLTNVVSDGVWLAMTNRQLRAFSMVVGNNSPLTNTSLNPSMKKVNRGKIDPLEDAGFKQYCEIIEQLAKPTIADSIGQHRCEVRGGPRKSDSRIRCKIRQT